MSKITEASRDHIADEDFAFPKERKEPIHDAAHMRNAELLAKNPILLAKVIDDLQLGLVHPSGDSDQNEPKRVQNSQHFDTNYREPLSLTVTCEKRVQIQGGRVFRPYGVLEMSEQCQERERLLREWTLCARRLTKLLLDEQLATVKSKAPSLAGFEEQIRLARAAETKACRKYFGHVNTHDCV